MQKLKPIWKTQVESTISNQMDTFEIKYYKSRQKFFTEDVMSEKAVSLL